MIDYKDILKKVEQSISKKEFELESLEKEKQIINKEFTEILGIDCSSLDEEELKELIEDFKNKHIKFLTQLEELQKELNNV